MRLSALSSKRRILLNTEGQRPRVMLDASNRAANGEAFSDEVPVRLPRRLSRTLVVPPFAPYLFGGD